MLLEPLPEQASSCQGLIYSVLQRPLLPAGGQGFTAALVGAHPGAGTTHLTAVLAQLLGRDAAGSVLQLACRELADLRSDLAISGEGISPGGNAPSGLSWLSIFEGSWRGSPDYRAALLGEVRKRFPYVLIDCPSLKESTDVLSLAPLVDGVLLVIEANRTRKSQVAYLERTIEGAGGKIYGHLLNKRTYPIPSWLHNRLESWGI
jgi:hypothetical protein